MERLLYNVKEVADLVDRSTRWVWQNAQALGGQKIPPRPGSRKPEWRFPPDVESRAKLLEKPIGRKPRNKEGLVCVTADCLNPVHIRDLCVWCYRRDRYENSERERRGYSKAIRYEIGEVSRSLKNGYVLEKAGPKEWKLQHRLVMERLLGRDLFPEETVHHKNLDHSDNRPENLELWSSRHPKGARVEDLIEYAQEILSIYKDLIG